MALRPRVPAALPLIAGLVILLLVLAALQYRWIGQVSEAEQQRLRARLEADAARFCGDVDRELASIAFSFRPQDETGRSLSAAAREAFERWNNTTRFPGLVAEVIVVEPGAGESVSVSCLSSPSTAPRLCEPPAALAAVRRDLLAGGGVPAISEELPGVVLTTRRPPPGAPGREPDALPAQPPPRAPGCVAVRLDRTYLAERLLPQLAREYFSRNGRLEYAVSVAPASRPHEVVYASSPAAAAGRADVERTFFALRAFPGGPGERPLGALDPARAPWPSSPPEGRPAGGPPGGFPFGPGGGRGGGLWVLRLSPAEGSLEQAVARTRRRNLALGGSVLALLGVAGMLIVASAQRARRLARQQMDFVAGVSHELRTPLTGIRTAGENLADGVVTDPEQVRGYGAMLAEEGKRLSQTVNRVLAFAGIQSDQATYTLRSLAVAELLDGVLSELRPAIEAKGVTLETDIARDLPAVAADAVALRQAIANLVDNALRHGATGGWIGVSARAAGAGPRRAVEIGVADRGDGIAGADLAHIFEPFYRGRAKGATTATGFGLGLAVVRHVVAAHGGRIEVASSPGRGARFTFTLPAATEGGTA